MNATKRWRFFPLATVLALSPGAKVRSKRTGHFYSVRPLSIPSRTVRRTTLTDSVNRCETLTASFTTYWPPQEGIEGAESSAEVQAEPVG
jgi:hypothetical protein